MKNNRQYAVLGLGIFGSTVSKTLSNYNCDVVAIDRNMECVQRLADIVHIAIQGDITDINVLKNAGVGDCDEESLLCILHLKEMGVPVIIAKAKNKQHRRILEKMGVTKVVSPEKEMGIQTAKTLLNRNIIDAIDLDEEYSIIEINVPNSWIGKSLIELKVRNRFQLNIIGIRLENNHLDITPSPKHVFSKEEHLLFLSSSDTITQLEFLEK